MQPLESIESPFTRAKQLTDSQNYSRNLETRLSETDVLHLIGSVFRHRGRSYLEC